VPTSAAPFVLFRAEVAAAESVAATAFVSAIALAFGALTLGVPHLQDTAAASLAEKKSPSPSGVKLAAPFWWGMESEWTNDGVKCPDPPELNEDGTPVKEVKEKFLNTTAFAAKACGAGTGDQCVPANRKESFDCMDKNSNGKVSTSEVEDYLVSHGSTKGMAGFILYFFDTNKDGTITRKEFNDATVCLGECK